MVVKPNSETFRRSLGLSDWLDFWGPFQRVRRGRGHCSQRHGGMKGDTWDNAAIVVLEAYSEVGAQRTVKEDLAVKVCFFRVQVRAFGVACISKKYVVEKVTGVCH